MIKEVAILSIQKGQSEAFQQAFSKAEKIIQGMPGFLNHQLLKCMEQEDRYILLVDWETLQDHTIGFRQSPEYQDWKALLHHFYDPFPVVEHYSSDY